MTGTPNGGPAPSSGVREGTVDGARQASPLRRNLLLACLAAVVGAALLWGDSLRDAADLAAVQGAIADHDWPRAESMLRARLASAPARGDAERQFLLGRVLRRQRRFPEAEEAFRAAEAAGHPAGPVARQRVLARAQTGEIRAVEREITRSMTETEDDAYAEDCYEALAEGFIAGYRMSDARECLDFWSRWQPGNPLPPYWGGMIEERYERPVLALEQYRRALELDPGFHEARLKVARLELDTGRLDEARGHFEECLAERPDEPAAVMGLAECLLRLGDPGGARERFLDGLCTDLSPDQAALALTELGQMALGEGDVKRGAALLSQAVAVDPRGTRARLSFAAALARVGDREEAERQRAEAERLAAAQRRLAQLTHDLLGAPGDAAKRAEAGVIFLEEGFEREGLQWLSSALAVDPDHAPTHRALADFHAARGDAEAEARHRSRAGDAEPPRPPAARGAATPAPDTAP